MKRLSFLCALIALATVPSMATAKSNAQSCIESATIAAGYYLTDVQEQYNEGKSDANLSALESSYNDFVKGSTDSSATQGIAYSTFGKDSSGNYIVTAYLGAHCGVATNTKLFCNLQKAGSNWTDSSSAPPDPVTGFYMTCKLCTGVKLSDTGSEASASIVSQFSAGEIKVISDFLNSAIERARHHGVTMTLTAASWPGSSCNTVTV